MAQQLHLGAQFSRIGHLQPKDGMVEHHPEKFTFMNGHHRVVMTICLRPIGQ